MNRGGQLDTVRERDRMCVIERERDRQSVREKERDT